MYSSATSQKGWLMPKALCLIGLVLSVLVALIFLFDLILGLSGQVALAPLKASSYVIDVLFLLAASGLAWTSWSTFKEQK